MKGPQAEALSGLFQVWRICVCVCVKIKQQLFDFIDLSKYYKKERFLRKLKVNNYWNHKNKLHFSRIDLNMMFKEKYFSYKTEKSGRGKNENKSRFNEVIILGDIEL